MKELYHDMASFAIACICMLASTLAMAQTVMIPDANFRQFLKDSFPSVMDSNDELILANAAGIIGPMNGQYKNISSVEGLQYFTAVQDVTLDHNNLTSLPDLSTMAALRDLKIDYNKLTMLPAFGSNLNLRELKCDYNSLTAIPSLAGLTQFRRLFCRGNKLTALPDLSNCTALIHVICTYNQLTYLPDFSTNPIFDRLICHNNLITSTPDYSLHPALASLLIANNQLSFDDLMVLARHPNFDTQFNYDPQDSLMVQERYAGDENKPLTLDLGIDDTVTSNTYYWYKNGTLISTTNTNTLTIASFQSTDAGTYYCQIKNNARSSWSTKSIYTIPFQVELTPCLVFNQTSYQLIENNCKAGATIEVNESSISNGLAPFQYELYNTLSGDKISSLNNTLSPIKNGVYELKVTDQNQCSKTIPRFFTLSEQATCDVVITPDGDGNNDDYYLENNGSIKLYDANGRLLNTLQGPTYWAGQNNQGERVPMGLYLLVIDRQKVINITVVY
jgi:hypothetical protein